MAEKQKTPDTLFVLVTGDKPRNLLPEEHGNLAYGAQMNRAFDKIAEQSLRQLQSSHPNQKIVVLSGLELGIEQAAARQALAMNLEVQAFVPFKNHGSNWSAENREQYQDLVSKIALNGAVTEVSQKEYNPNLVQLRDYQIVDKADVVVSLHNPDLQPQNPKLLDYAAKHSKEIINIWEGSRNLINDAASKILQTSARGEIFKENVNLEKVVDVPRKRKTEIWERIIRADVKNNPDKIFLFGDNLKETGLGGQAKEMRGEVNSIGIPTKKAPDNNPNSFFTDKELEANKQAIDRAFAKIPPDKTIVIPKAGLGTGLAKLDEKAPETFKYLNSKLTELKLANPQQNRASGIESTASVQTNTQITSVRLLDLDRIQSENLKALQPNDAEKNALAANRTEALARYAERLRQEYKSNNQGLRDGMQLLTQSLDAGTRININCDCRSAGAMCHADVVKMAIEKVHQHQQKLDLEKNRAVKIETEKLQPQAAQKPEARVINPRTQRAINEILAVSETDRALAQLNQTEGRNQSEQANFLSEQSQFVRDVYERGAQVRDGVLIVPEEKLGVSPPLAVATHEYAVGKLLEITKDEMRAKELAPQIVEYGNQIAGDTGDGATKLRVFKWVYDSLEGKTEFLATNETILANDEQSHFDRQLAQIRNLAEAMRELEPSDRLEFQPLGHLENDLSAEKEHAALEPDENFVRAEIYEEAVSREIGSQTEDLVNAVEHEKSVGGVTGEGYERTELTNVPQLPSDIGEYKLNQLLTQKLPEIDRQLENGIALKEILKSYNDDVKQSALDNALNRLETVYRTQKIGEINRQLADSNLVKANKESLTAEKTALENGVLTPTQEELRAVLAERDEISHLENKLQNFVSHNSLDNRKAERNRLEFRLETLKLEQTKRDEQKTKTTISSVAGKHTNAAADKELNRQLNQINVFRQNVIELDSPAQFLRTADAAEKAFYKTIKTQKHDLREKLDELKNAAAPDIDREKQLKAELNKISTLQPSFAFKLKNSDSLIVGEASAKTIEDRNFAASYVQFQLQKPEVRLRRENERYRTYAARLDAAANRSEVLKIASVIRAENAELGLSRQSSNNQKTNEPRPLTNAEMQRLFVEQSPRHYTPEMTVTRLSFAHSGESRKLMTASLMRGEIKPSAEAQKLIDSLESRLNRQHLNGAIAATKHFFESLKTPNHALRYKNEFDHREVYRLLPPQEKDFVYQKTVQQKENLEYRLVYEQQEFIKSVSTEKTDEQSKQRSTAAEKSFHLLSQFNQAANLADRIEAVALETAEVSKHDAATIGILLTNNSAEKNFDISRELQQSQSETHNKLGEILAAFSRAEISDEAGKKRVTIEIPTQSRVGQEAYRELLEKFYPDKLADLDKFRIGSLYPQAIEDARIKAQNQTLKTWSEQTAANVYRKTATANVFEVEQKLNQKLESLKQHQDAARTARSENHNIVVKYTARAAAKPENKETSLNAKTQHSIVRFALNGETNKLPIQNDETNKFLQSVQNEITISDFRKFASNEQLVAEKRDLIQSEFQEITVQQAILKENRVQTLPVRARETLQDIYQTTQQREESRLLTESARELLRSGGSQDASNQTIAETISRQDAEQIKQNSFKAARIEIEPEYLEHDAHGYNEQAFKLADKIQTAHELSIGGAARNEEIERAFAAAEAEKSKLIEKLAVEPSRDDKPLTFKIYESEIAKAEKEILRKTVSEKLKSQKDFQPGEKLLDLSNFVTNDERRIIAERAAELAKERLEPRELAADHRKIGDAVNKQVIATFKQLEFAHNVYQLTEDSAKTREAFVKLDEQASLLGELRRQYNRTEKSALLRDGIKSDLINLMQKSPNLKTAALVEQTNRILLENLSKSGFEIKNYLAESIVVSRELSGKIETAREEIGKELKLQNSSQETTLSKSQEKLKHPQVEVKHNFEKAKEAVLHSR